MEISMFLSDGILKQNVHSSPSSDKSPKQDAAANWALLHHTEFNSKLAKSCRTDASVMYTEFNAYWSVAWI